ncbi:MAG: DUF72 domain-containing protein, partial [Bdellovibrionales bacterium]|nr:DUF72 domain-containing protein [Ramlibacter sp.]
QSRLKTGYAPKALDRWAQAARIWQGGGEPPDVPRVQDAAAQPPAAKAAPRDVFMFFISGAKERAPAAAMALIKKLSA